MSKVTELADQMVQAKSEEAGGVPIMLVAVMWNTITGAIESTGNWSDPAQMAEMLMFVVEQHCAGAYSEEIESVVHDADGKRVVKH